MMIERDVGGRILIVFISIWGFVPFLGLSIWAFKRKTPMHFWAGSTVEPSEITDIPAYNRSNGRMWFIYGIGIFLACLSMLINPVIGSILIGLLCSVGIFVLRLVYKRIYVRYSVKTEYLEIAPSPPVDKS